MKKVDIGFRFRPEVVERLGTLALERSCTRTAVLEALIMGASDGGTVEEAKVPRPEEARIDREKVAVAQDWLKPRGKG
jgi:hypothetical protein